MVHQEFSETCECKVSSKRMWHGLFKDGHNCLPRALPHKVLAVEYPHGQHDFSFPGAVRVIKFHVVTDALHKAAQATEKFFHGEEESVKKEAEKVEGAVHKEEQSVEKKAEEAAKEVHKEAEKVEGAIHKEEEEAKEEEEKAAAEAHKEAEIWKQKAAEVGGTVHKEEEAVKEKVEEVGEEVHKKAEEAGKEAECAKEEVVGAGHKVAHKAIGVAEKVVHTEEQLVAAAVHKVGDFLDHVELEVKEKIEEVDHEAYKIKVSILAGGLVGVLFKHCKHTFQIKEKHGGGSILTWKSEFELLEHALHLVNAFEEHKKHTLDTIHHVEAYLLKHGDYA